MSLFGKGFCRLHYEKVNLKVSGSLQGINKMQFHSYHVSIGEHDGKLKVCSNTVKGKIILI